jgi:hypothetical protein
MRHLPELLGILSFCAAIACASAQSSSLRAEITVTQAVVNNTPAKPTRGVVWPDEFTIFTAIRNTGNNDQTIEVWACGFPYQWQVDNPTVHVDGGPCLQNSFRRIRLRPAQVYKRSIPAFMELPPTDALLPGPKAVTFRLAFCNEFWNEKLRAGRQAVWSNPITLTVINPR